MARRATKAEGRLVAAAVIFGLPIYGLSKIFESIGWVIPLFAVIAIAMLFAWYQHDQKQKRLSYLREKFGDEEIVQKILGRYFCQGQTQEQLLESLGPPVAVDNALLKTKTREVWKYHRQGVNRFALRITVENGLVSGWDKKS